MKLAHKLLVVSALALCLPFLMFEIRIEKAGCSFDYCTYDWDKGLIMPFRFVYVSVGTKDVFPQSNPPLNTTLTMSQEGIYAREGIPVAIAAVIGIAIPILLFGWTMRRVVTGRRGKPSN